MTVPEQVRKRAARAQELIDQLATPTESPAPTPAPTEPPIDSPAPTPAPVDIPQPTPAPTPAPPPESEDFKQKYLTLQGVFNAESRRWNSEKKVFEERLAALETARQTPAPTPAPAPVSTGQLFSQEEIDRFGPDLLNMIEAKARTIAGQIVTEKTKELAPSIERTAQRVEQVGQAVYANAEEKFWGELAKAVPDLQSINVDSRWLQWLGQEDEISGFSRQQLLDTAARNLDHQRVAKLFGAFKKEAGIAESTATPSPTPAPAPAQQIISPSPKTVGNATAPTLREPQGDTVKRSEIAAHYRKATTDPTYRSSKEYGDMDKRIAQAMSAGKVVEG